MDKLSMWRLGTRVSWRSATLANRQAGDVHLYQVWVVSRSEYGVMSRVSKPFDFHDLQRRIHAILD